MSNFKLTDAGWNNIKDMLNDWENNPKSNYSDKERFFKQWFEAFIDEIEGCVHCRDNKKAGAKICDCNCHDLPDNFIESAEKVADDFIFELNGIHMRKIIKQAERRGMNKYKEGELEEEDGCNHPGKYQGDKWCDPCANKRA